MIASGACGGGAARRGRTVVFASGAELQSMNPLVTIHPLAKQVQRYVLLTTLARYDTALVPRPYLARMWVWSPDLQALRFRLHSGVRWHDGTPTTARDVVWTLNAARDPATGYPRRPRRPPRARGAPRGGSDPSWWSWTTPAPSSPRSRRARGTSPGSSPRTRRSCVAPRGPRCSTTR